ncbi:serine hydrolase [Aquamicrobium sp. LC103]|uniref:serine hydrolase domain-containing protein n=1 Tax=Aquamicrobium sp. LC103 TaxID=1120658 RepID=UPI00063E9571|nr:serine hydrolase [Aquamicrobium sp. LC103]TKT76173.1 serine hydrolase [Aquamicrobium sp. LC103]
MTAHEFTRSDISLSNWRTRPFSTWTFQNVGEIVPSAVIASARVAENAPRPLGSFAGVRARTVEGAELTLPEFLHYSHSDALVVMRRGEIIAEWYAPHADPSKPHIIFSISKSFTGLLAGILIDKGLLSADDLVSKYVPESIGSAYGDVTIRDLLNMQVSIEFDEVYLDRSGAFDRYRRAMLWNPERSDEETMTLRALFRTLPKGDHPHGTRHMYRSPNADMAAIVLEEAAGERYADMISKYIWRPMGAHSDAFVTLDRAGNPRASGGISVTARDLARLGELMRNQGGGILPTWQVAEIFAGGDREIWRTGDQGPLYPGGSYRHFWYETGAGAVAGMGIHGQSVWVDPASETVVVRNSSEPVPINDALDQRVIAMLKAICAA